jgi:hypothetical protein
VLAAVVAFSLAGCGALSGSSGSTGSSGPSTHEPGVAGGPVAKGLHLSASTKTRHHQGSTGKKIGVRPRRAPKLRQHVFRGPPPLRTPRAPRMARRPTQRTFLP